MWQMWTRERSCIIISWTVCHWMDHLSVTIIEEGCDLSQEREKKLQGVFDRTLQPADGHLADSHRIMRWICCKKYDLKHALDLYQKALSILTKALNEDHLNVLTVWRMLPRLTKRQETFSNLANSSASSLPNNQDLTTTRSRIAGIRSFQYHSGDETKLFAMGTSKSNSRPSRYGSINLQLNLYIIDRFSSLGSVPRNFSDYKLFIWRLRSTKIGSVFSSSQDSHEQKTFRNEFIVVGDNDLETKGR